MAPAASAGASRRSRSRKGEGRQLRDEIMDATERLLLATGSSEAVSIRAVADAVGVTPPSIYRHFADKATLILEVSDRHFGTLDVLLDDVVEGLDDPVEALTAIGRAYIEFGRTNPEPYRIMFMTRSEDPPERLEAKDLTELAAFRHALRCVQACIDTGRFRPEHRDPTRVTIGFWARVHGLTTLLVAKPHFPWPDDDRFVADYLDSCLRGLLAGSGDR